MSLDDFIEDVQEDFINNQNYYLSSIQALLPEVHIAGIELAGTYSFDSEKMPIEESDIDLKVFYSGPLLEIEVAERLYGKIHGVGGTFDIIPIGLKQNPNPDELIPSVSIEDKPQFAVVTTKLNSGYGVGIFSWHVFEEDAEHNAKITKGMVVPVDYVGGQLIIPPFAEAAIRRALYRDMRGYEF